MNTSRSTKQKSKIIVELINFDFNWVPSDGENAKEKGSTTSLIRIWPVNDDDTAIYGICDINFTRQDFPQKNFKILSRFFYSYEASSPRPRNRKAWEQELAKGIIWTKFAELARMAVVNFGSPPHDIPLFPDKVLYDR